MRPYADVIDMIMKKEQMSATGEYDSLKQNPSIMDDPSAYVIEYRSYWLSMSKFPP